MARPADEPEPLEPLADENGFIVVYPSGSGVPKIWHVDRGAGLMRDVRFISELIDTVRAGGTTSTRRDLLPTGFPLAAAWRLCFPARLSDRVAAVGMVAAAQSLPSSWCTDKRPVPMWRFMGR